MDTDELIGQIVNIKPNIISATPLLAGRKAQGYVVQVVGHGRNQFFALRDIAGRPFPGWFRREELIPTLTRTSDPWERIRRLAERNERKKQAATARNLSQQIDLSQEIAALKIDIAALQRRPATPPADIEAEVLRLARQYAETHRLDLATATQRVLASAEHAALAAAWRSQVLRPERAPAIEDTELTRLARERATAKKIDFRNALQEVTRERVDLADRFAGALHSRRDESEPRTADAALLTEANTIIAEHRTRGVSLSVRDALSKASAKRLDLSQQFQDEGRESRIRVTR